MPRFLCADCHEYLNQPGADPPPPALLPRLPPQKGAARVAYDHSARVPVAPDDGQLQLNLLRKLPRVFPYQPILRIPDCFTRQAATVLWTLLTSANMTVGLPEQQADAAHLAHELLRAAPMLLFRPKIREQRDTPDSGQSPGALDAEGGPGTRQEIRERLNQATVGNWTPLISELLTDLQRHAAVPGVETRETYDPEEDLPAAVLQAAVVKCRMGSGRGAVNILTSAPPVPPSQAVAEQVRELFCCRKRNGATETKFQ